MTIENARFVGPLVKRPLETEDKGRAAKRMLPAKISGKRGACPEESLPIKRCRIKDIVTKRLRREELHQHPAFSRRTKKPRIERARARIETLPPLAAALPRPSAPVNVLKVITNTAKTAPTQRRPPVSMKGKENAGVSDQTGVRGPDLVLQELSRDISRLRISLR